MIAPHAGKIHEGGKAAWRVDTLVGNPFARQSETQNGARPHLSSSVRWEVVGRPPNDFLKDFLEFRAPLSMGHSHVGDLPLQVLSKAGVPGSVL
jgi:hypothetical protein